MSSTYKAKLDSFDLTILSTGTNDSWEKNISLPDIPFSAGANHDSMGLKEHSVQFTCVFKNGEYSTHAFFVQHVIQDLTNTLVHPVYGAIKGMVKGVSVRNDDRIKYAEVDITFVESVDDDAIPVYTPDVQYAVEQEFLTAQKNQIAQMETSVRSTLGTSAADSVLSVSIDSNKSIISQFPKVSWKTRNFISKIADAKSVFDGALTDIENPAESIIATVEYGTSLPGVVLKSIAECVERYAYAAEQVSKSPLAFISSFRTGINDLAMSAGLLKNNLIITASQIAAIFIAELYSSDEESRVELDKIENSTIWKPDGTMVYTPETPEVLTVNDLEKSLYMCRADIQTAINAIRAEGGSSDLICTLKNTASNLQQYIDKTKLVRETLVTIELESEMPVHALCLRYGLPFMAAERVCAVNSFWNPSFCSGKVSIYV